MLSNSIKGQRLSYLMNSLDATGLTRPVQLGPQINRDQKAELEVGEIGCHNVNQETTLQETDSTFTLQEADLSPRCTYLMGPRVFMDSVYVSMFY